MNTVGKNVFNLESFKEMMVSNDDFKNEIIGKEDIIDEENGLMTIYSENINKYLEKYACKDFEDLQNTLYYSYGIFCKII